MLSVNPASGGSSASSATDTSNIAAFVSQNSIGILSTVPSSPTSVVAVSGNTQLAVTWTAPANTGGSAITDYLVKYSSNGGSTWTNFVHPVSTVPSLTVTGLTNGTAYVIKVIAKNAVGISLPSANSAPVSPALLAVSMVTVGDVGNAADTTGYGDVLYSYQIADYDVTGSQYTAFLNAVGSTDTYALYSSSMGTDPIVAQISRSGTAGTYTYAVMNSTGSRPISYVSWFDSARFSNWMSNGQPSGAQSSTTTENGAYNVNGATTGNAVAANATNPNTGSAPTYRIPLQNEWYKAAYYKGGSTNAGYWTYATQSDSAPGTTIGSGANQANYNGVIGYATDVGSFSGSGSFYGTFDQSGNVNQWNDLDGTTGSPRGLRGGFWSGNSYSVSSSGRIDLVPSLETSYVGFRLASPVTVPSSPTSVVATSGNAQLAVTWAAPASTGGSNITDYLVKYSSNNGVAGSWTRFFPSPVVPITATACTVTGLTNGTAYVIKVIARNSVGISLPSANSAPATPAAIVPGSPTAVVAVSGNASLAVSWTAPASTGGSAITDYLVKYSSNNGVAGSWTRWGKTTVIAATSCTVTGLTNGTAYVIKVIARNSDGISLPSANSAPVSPALLAMSMVTVGNVGNAADANTGSVYGAVSYSYQIGTYDVTGSQYTAFLNAVGSTDTYALYNASMGTDTNVAQISQSGTSGSYTYAVMNGTGSRPISYVSWFDSARFSNWMSNRQPSGAQSSTTTENGAYNVNGATSGNAVAANATNPNTGSAPTYRIPLENEWYKAAYYSPNSGGTGVGGYWTYATQSNSDPGTTIGSGANQANYLNAIGTATDVGSFSGSGSFYGTFDQSGNVWQWNDLDGTAGSSRGQRGGYWNFYFSYGVSSSYRYGLAPSGEFSDMGFRLASPVTTTLNPTFGTQTATADGFTVPITNYDSSYTWAGTATASGSVVISGTGLVTVTGVAANTSSTATITTTKSNTVGGSATVTATSLFFAMSMMTVGNPGNAADTTGYGAVSYSYQIAAYDVTGSQYTAFLNAVGSTDTYGLYNTSMDTNTNVAQISQSGSSGSYTYAVLNSTGSRPISYVSWFDSARFSNWMSNGQPSGAQTSTTTEDGAYNVNGATSGNAVAANATNPNTGLAPTFSVPLENEWYKAAYYSPNYGGTGVGGYYRFATQSDTDPGTTIGSSANQANYANLIGHATDVGSFSGSGSFYGTFDQSGNVWQWNDLDGTTGSSRGLRGGGWDYDSGNVSSSGRFSSVPSFEYNSFGFRLASPV